MDELLPTPSAEKHTPQRREDFTPNLTFRVQELTSVSSPGSEDSTSPSRPTGSGASGRSSGTPPALESSSDGGRLFPDGETFEGSALLASPMAGTNRKSETAMRSSRDDGGNGRRSGGGNSSSPRLEQQVEALLPTPNAGLTNYDENPETWRARQADYYARTGKGNGPNNVAPLGVAISELTSSSEGSPASPPAPQGGARAPRTTAGSGPSSPVSLASWDPELFSWRTSQVSLLSTEDERFPRSSERWPTSGMTRRGQAFALPTLARATGASGSSSLPTPRGQDSYERRNRKTMERIRDEGGDMTLPTFAKTVIPLLHTPTSTDSDGKPSTDDRASPGYTRKKPVPNLMAQIADDLLPTPRTSDTNGAGEHGDGGPDLRTTVGSLGDPTPPPSHDGSES